MRYLAKITQDYWAIHNKAQEAARQVAQNMDRQLLRNADERLRFITDMKLRIHNVNQDHPRCKSLEIQSYGPHIGPIKRDEDCFLVVPGVFHMTIYTIKDNDYDPNH